MGSIIFIIRYTYSKIKNLKIIINLKIRLDRIYTTFVHKSMDN